MCGDSLQSEFPQNDCSVKSSGYVTERGLDFLPTLQRVVGMRRLGQLGTFLRTVTRGGVEGLTEDLRTAGRGGFAVAGLSGTRDPL